MIKITSCSVVMDVGRNRVEFHRIRNSFWCIFSGRIFETSLYNGYSLLGEGSKLALHTLNEVEQVLVQYNMTVYRWVCISSCHQHRE